MERRHAKKIIKIGAIILAVAIVFGYAIFASHNFIEGPKIVVLEPENGSTHSTSTILIRGIIYRSQNVTLNGKSIFIDDEGNFKENTLLFPGYNAVTITAEDKFGRFREYRLELIYKVN